MLTLSEHTTAAGVELTQAEAVALRAAVPSMTVAPSWDGHNRWDLTPGADVGVVSLGAKTVVINPKVPLDRVLFMASYGGDLVEWQQLAAEVGTSPTLVELMATALVREVRRSLRRGLLQGYRVEEEALTTVRGRIRFDDQLRHRLGQAVPVELRHDEYTEDIEVNRLLKAALWRVAHLPLRSRSVRAGVSSYLAILGESVTLVEYTANNLPQIEWTRLNIHYRPAVDLALLVLRFTSIEVRHGAVRASGLVMNMNVVFETFVRQALRESLGLSAAAFPVGASGRAVHLDDAGRVDLQPDLSWWEGDRCVFVGDVKYKPVNAKGIKHPDLYQLLAYVTALKLPAGLLVYAVSPEAVDASHGIAAAGKRLDVVALDLSGEPAQILLQIDAVAERVRSMRREAGELVTSRSAGSGDP